MEWHYLSIWCLLMTFGLGLPYLEDEVNWNLNQNQTATNPLDYWGEWENHQFHPSPQNWRMPFYTITLDRFVNGDPTNDQANDTAWEHDVTSNQFRFGGDVKGLQDNLDYIQGMGIKCLYLAGSPFINMPWASDGYSPLDMTLLDHHHGVIADWRATITDIHSRGMYVILDNTMATMGDLLGFTDYLNDTSGTPFSYKEHDVNWKSSRQYWDFQYGNDYNESCAYPEFWYDEGYAVGENVTSQFVGCKNSEFNQYGEVDAFGSYPDWEKQISKFAHVQDRLREWVPSVRNKIERFSCITIAMLDIDGFRMDKGVQITVDAQAAWASTIRECAKSLNKTNFFIPGEIVDGNTYAAMYVGRGKLGVQEVTNLTEAVMANSTTNVTELYMREFGNSALDGAAFHYTIYRALTIFLGLDGEIGAVGDNTDDLIEAWQQIVATNDFVNANTGVYDPRHLFGLSNQDVFRWPSLANGTQRQLLGNFVTTLMMPGAPLLVWGEEQAFYVLDNQATNYVFGRTPMTSNQAWQSHGCYKLDEIWYTDMPWDSALTGCNDDTVSLDHRDPSHPVRNILKRMYQLRDQFPVLNDGYVLEKLSNTTHFITFRGSGDRASEFGIWSVLRSRTVGVQDFTGQGQGNQSVWFVYTNENSTIEHTFDCSAPGGGLLSPFAYDTTVKNLFYPYEEYNLTASTQKLGLESSTEFNGCIDQITFAPWEYKALVPVANFVEPTPVITRVLPGHDSRMVSGNSSTGTDTIPIEIHFSANMSCEAVTNSLYFNSTTHSGQNATLDTNSINCLAVSTDQPFYVGGIPTAWIFKANLTNVYNGVHTFTVGNISSLANASINSENPMIFPNNGILSQVFHKNATTSDLYVAQNAAGADLFRYSLNWGSSYSSWSTYSGSNYTLTRQAWSGTELQEWDGEHVILQYWSRLTGSADHVQHAELLEESISSTGRRFPHIFTQGAWNKYALDAGLPNAMKLVDDNMWIFNFMAEWPSTIAFNVWGINPDGLPDTGLVFGDVDGDGVLDRVPPITLLENNVSIPAPPQMPYLSWRLTLNDTTLGYTIEPAGSAWHQLIMFILMAVIPIISGSVAVYLFRKSFYGVKHNFIGVREKVNIFSSMLAGIVLLRTSFAAIFKKKSDREAPTSLDDALAGDLGAPNRRKVLIATCEYDIEDWDIKIKIGGLGVMASLMGKNLGHQDLIWVVPCVGGIDYPEDNRVEPMSVTILGNQYDVEVQYHVVRNITYVLLDSPVFRTQTKAEPYPARMDDVDSAVYYSAWNSCIAEAIRRFNPDIYHINDYHGTIAPLHLLPRTIPICLSLHNAEFQGLWPMRTPDEIEEVCSLYDLSYEVVQKYVQFGEVFNLLHAGASYLRIHQKGFGAVGVSKKYGVRSFARYSIFWGLSKIGALPNPDPSDQEPWNKNEKGQIEDVPIDRAAEAARGELRVQAQKWAGLKQDATAELFVFVGRWSMQKGVDLIADVFPSVLENSPKAQLICVGPVIDLYGKFAAMKLEKMMTKYPERVFSKPVFTALPPFIFSGAEFALIPSRDEPFGLVAVEFGRKGALGVGARVGGLGQMPGWWFTIESTTTKHLIKQFKMAIQDALVSKVEVREQMRARSALQRFPVAQWVEDLGILQSTSIQLHQKYSSQKGNSVFTGVDSELLQAPPRLHDLSSSASSTRSHESVASRILSSSWFGPGRFSRNSTSNPQSPAPSVRGPSKLRRSSRANSSATLDVELAIRNPNQSTSQNNARQNGLGELVEDESSRDSNSEDASRISSLAPSRALSLASTRQPSLRELQGVELENSRLNPDGVLMDSPQPAFAYLNSRSNSTLSLSSVVGDRVDMKLQAVDPFFVDSTGLYAGNFENMLESLDGKTSEDQLCIEVYLKKSEKQWYGRYYDAKLGKTSSPAVSIFQLPWGNRSNSNLGESGTSTPRLGNFDDDGVGQFGLRDDHVIPTGLRRLLLQKIGDWPVYAFLLAFGQIIAANSYQITLLIGQNGEEASELYIVASIYLAASVFWWFILRHVKAVYALSLPFIFYGFAFFLVGMVPQVVSSDGKSWMQYVAISMYAIASASGFMFFAHNFGSEGGSSVDSWAFRACVIQGTQQIYVSALWYWGTSLSSQITNGVVTSSLIQSKPIIAAITTPIAFLFWTIGLVLFFGLPSFYRQEPGKVPSFYRAVCRRKIIQWFIVMVILQNYWMSAPTGRNWSYLWSSTLAPAWSVLILVLFFFIVVWCLMVGLLGYLSKSDSWVIPIFAIGLGAPRWCQMLWGISNIGLYVPWAGSGVASALVGRTLWLWLGVLDAVQGVGFGMILMQTLTRLHVTFALVAAQVIGSLATIAARATAPNKIGPGTVFPDFSGGFSEGLGESMFWLGLLFQGVICIGFFVFFRKEQLFKP